MVNMTYNSLEHEVQVSEIYQKSLVEYCKQNTNKIRYIISTVFTKTKTSFIRRDFSLFYYANILSKESNIAKGWSYVKEVTKLLINDFKIRQLNYDFMGYSLQRGDIYTFHHFLIANRENGPYAYWNGVILCGKTSHPYLHLIESKDEERFYDITSEFLDMKNKGYLDIENLRYIDDILTNFEKEYCGKRSKKGKILIKEEYTKRVKLWIGISAWRISIAKYVVITIIARMI